MYIKVCLHERCVPCSFVHAKIAYVHAFRQSFYVRIVFIKTHNLHFTMNIFLSSIVNITV